MDCFLGCFGNRKNRRRQKRRESDQVRANKLFVESAKHDHRNDRIPTVEEITKTSVILITDLCDKAEEKCSPRPTRKRVTFDYNVKIDERIELQESVELLEEKKEDVKSKEKPLNSSKTGQSSSEIINVTSNSSSHRYNNCRESDDEEAEDEIYCDDLDDDEEYYSDDGFIENEFYAPTKQVYNEEIEDNGSETENTDVNQRGVLNLVENLTQCKPVKSSGKTIQKNTQKENSSLLSDQEEKRDSISLDTAPQIDVIPLSFKPKSRIEPKKPRNQDLTVEASLSTWLSSSETTSECNSVSMETPTPEKNNSRCYSKPAKNSHDDRPILGALTLEEINQFSGTSTPRKSPNKNLDETPIIGTVGGYWGNQSKAKDIGSASSFKGIPNTTRKYREDNKVKWHSTPFEARLEKALNKQI